jgi:hypothetical protein
VPKIIKDARAAGVSTFELEFAPDWAAAREIGDKRYLISERHRSGITFYFFTNGTIVFGWFDY